MRSFRLRELLLLSEVDRRARSIKFHPQTTLLTSRGGNNTGKSTVLKSIIASLGAEPRKINKKWRQAQPQSLLRFHVDEDEYAMLRMGKSFALFKERRCIGNFTSVGDLAPHLAEIFGFRLILTNRAEEQVVPPPAYFLLPFYIDQDKGWTGYWQSLDRLGQFAGWQNHVLPYHAGIRGRDYFEILAARDAQARKREEVLRRKETLERVYAGVREKFERIQFEVDFTRYESELQRLLEVCEKLRKQEESFRHKLSELRSERELLSSQLAITRHAREEAEADVAFAVKQGALVDCPICGAVYDNDAVARFPIIANHDNWSELALSLSADLTKVDAEIEKFVAESRRAATALSEVEALLARREGEVQLVDMIQQASRAELRSALSADVSALDDEAGQYAADIARRNDKLTTLDSREHRKKVNDFFNETLARLLDRLRVNGVEPRGVLSTSDTGSGGSDSPRAVLAYRVAFLHVMKQFGDTAFGPFIVDSPHQQDQSELHYDRMLEVLAEHLPEGTQLVLAALDAHNVDFAGDEVMLEKEFGLLLDDEYEAVGAVIRSYANAAEQHGSILTPSMPST